MSDRVNNPPWLDENGTYSLPAMTTAWLAVNPAITNDVDGINGVIDDFTAIFSPYGIEKIATNAGEYALSPDHRSELTLALRQRAIEYIFIAVSIPEATTHADLFVQIPRDDGLHQAIAMYLRAGSHDVTTHTYLQPQTGALAKAWVSQFDTAAAWISWENVGAIGDDPWQTRFESQRRRRLSTSWEIVNRYLRGAFWCNYLGPNLCQQMGGADKVIQNAPVWKVQRRDNGVWLQTSATLPPSDRDLRELAAYLHPLLDW